MFVFTGSFFLFLFLCVAWGWLELFIFVTIISLFERFSNVGLEKHIFQCIRIKRQFHSQNSLGLQMWSILELVFVVKYLEQNQKKEFQRQRVSFWETALNCYFVLVFLQSLQRFVWTKNKGFSLIYCFTVSLNSRNWKHLRHSRKKVFPLVAFGNQTCL